MSNYLLSLHVNYAARKSFLKNVSESGQPYCAEWLNTLCKNPVWKIWEEFETFLENKQISQIRKKHLGDQIVINSYVYMFFNCDQS